MRINDVNGPKVGLLLSFVLGPLGFVAAVAALAVLL